MPRPGKYPRGVRENTCKGCGWRGPSTEMYNCDDCFEHRKYCDGCINNHEHKG